MKKENTNSEEKDEQVAKGQQGSSHDAKIDAIKEIIFGQNMKEYSEQFDDINRLIERTEDKINKQHDETKEELLETIKELKEDIDNRLTDMQISISNEIDKLTKEKTDRNDLAELLEAMAKKLRY